jgi:hypothetical protein
MDVLMADAGIEDLEELHQRFIETEYADVPVSGLHRSKSLSLELLKRLAFGRVRYTCGRVISGVLEVVGVERRSEAGTGFIVTYVFGERRR